MRVLVLSAAVPFPPHGGGRMRTYQLIKALTREHDVTVAAFTFEGERIDEVDLAVRLVPVPWAPSPDLAALNGPDASAALEAAERLRAPDGPPWIAGFYESDAMRHTLAGLRDAYDLVLLEGSDMGIFLPQLSGIVVLDLMDVYTAMALRNLMRADTEEAPELRLEAERTRRFESEVAQRSDLCLAVSRLEAQAAQDLLGVDRVAVVQNGVDTSYFLQRDATESEPGNVLFTGTMNYGPNIEAARTFAEQVLPKVRAEVGNAHLHIVGAGPTPEVLRLRSDSVTVHGSVEDMRPYLARAEVVGVPLRSGGGTRLKILEAASTGRCVVSTSVGAEGLDLKDGEHLLIADDMDGFADAVVQLLRDPDRRARLGGAARRAMTAYDWQVVGGDLLAAVGRLA